MRIHYSKGWNPRVSLPLVPKSPQIPAPELCSFQLTWCRGGPEMPFPAGGGCPSVMLGGGEAWGGPKSHGCKHWAEANTPQHHCVSRWERWNSNHLFPQDFLQHNLGFPAHIRLPVMSPVSQALHLPMYIPWSLCDSFGESTGFQEAQESGPGADVLVWD